MGQYGNGVQWVGDTVVCHGGADHHAHETVTLSLRTRPTNVNKLHYTTLGQTKMQLTSTDTPMPAAQTGFDDKTTGSSATEPSRT